MTATQELPSDRDLLIHLLGFVETANATAIRLHRWLKQRMDEEQSNWDECARQNLPNVEAYERLAKWGITIEGWNTRLDELTDRLALHLEPLQEYLPVRPPASNRMRDLLAATPKMCALEQRAAAAEVWLVYIDEVDRQHKEIEMLKTRIRFQLGEQKNGPDEGYLGLIVDRAHGGVRRKGHDATVYFETTTAEWHWFIVAYRTEERGATLEELLNGYPGDRDPEPRRAAKSRANKKLKVLDVMLAPSLPPKLVENTGT